MQKTAIAYHRFSSDKQNPMSLERQATVTTPWAKQNNCSIIDLFEDSGYSATTFDRPDVKKLFAFIKKNHHRVDYILVSDLIRFSREMTDAMQMVRYIQDTYHIRIVSCSSNHICDYYDHNSFIRMTLEFMFANADNLKRRDDINGGVYVARRDGKFIGSKAPFGYTKDENKKLVINETEAATVRFIFDSYVNGLPLEYIRVQAKEKGYNRDGKSGLQTWILANTNYIAMQKVKPWKDHPGGMYPGDWLPLIDNNTFQRAQERLQGKKRKGVSISDDFPLRGVLRCHDGALMTGAPSKSGSGKYHNYYKCNHGGKSHNNVSTTFAHNQLHQALQCMNLQPDDIDELQQLCNDMLKQELQENKLQITSLRQQLAGVVNRLHSLEEKFIDNLVAPETYQRLQPQYMQQRAAMASQIETLAKADCHTFDKLQDNFAMLTKMEDVYQAATVSDKQQLLNLLFDGSLYYQNRIYRTTYMMDIFAHSELILKEKELLIVEKKPGFIVNPGKVELQGTLSNRITQMLSIFQSIKVA